MKKIGKIALFSVIFLLLILAFATVTAFARTATTTEPQTVIFFNGSDWWTSQESSESWHQMPTPPYVDEAGNYFVPVSVLREAFGMNASETKGNTVTVQTRDHMIYQGIDNICVYVNGTPYNDVAPFRAEDGVVMVPIERYLSAFGYQTEYQTSDTYPNGFLVITRKDQTVIPTRIEVNKYMQMVTVYGKDYAGKEIPCRYMVCSTGTTANETPVGTYRIRALHYFSRSDDPWYYFATSKCWIQYCTQISGGVCFHSVPYAQYAYSSLSQSGYNNLGKKASHGCVRLLPADARYIWENCSGLSVTISNSYYSELLQQKKTAILKAKLPYKEFVKSLNTYGVQD